jgi:hypothetical protein
MKNVLSIDLESLIHFYIKHLRRWQILSLCLTWLGFLVLVCSVIDRSFGQVPRHSSGIFCVGACPCIPALL